VGVDGPVVVIQGAQIEAVSDTDFLSLCAIECVDPQQVIAMAQAGNAPRR